MKPKKKKSMKRKRNENLLGILKPISILLKQFAIKYSEHNNNNWKKVAEWKVLQINFHN